MPTEVFPRKLHLHEMIIEEIVHVLQLHAPGFDNLVNTSDIHDERRRFASFLGHIHQGNFLHAVARPVEGVERGHLGTVVTKGLHDFIVKLLERLISPDGYFTTEIRRFRGANFKSIIHIKLFIN